MHRRAGRLGIGWRCLGALLLLRRRLRLRLRLLLLLLLELLLLLQQLMLLLLSKLRMHSAGHHGQRLTLPGLAYACSHGR